jgi:hypothetical protein
MMVRLPDWGEGMYISLLVFAYVPLFFRRILLIKFINGPLGFGDGLLTPCFGGFIAGFDFCGLIFTPVSGRSESGMRVGE